MAKHNVDKKLPGKLTVSEDEIAGKNRKQLGQEIQGDPDEWDRKNIQNFIDLFERAFPGQIAKLKSDYAVELALSGRTKDFSEISKASEMRLSMWLPGGLQEVLEQAYPSIWTNKKHLSWFLKEFPQFKGAPRH